MTEQATLLARVADISRHPHNASCAECGTRDPSWSSANLGIFVCIRCSGLHRKLGTHISKVRSTTMDRWIPEFVDNCGRVGNVVSNMIFEAKRPSDCPRPDDMSSSMTVESFIRAKYERMEWIHPSARKYVEKNAAKSLKDPSVGNICPFPDSLLDAIKDALTKSGADVYVYSPLSQVQPSSPLSPRGGESSPREQSKKSKKDSKKSSRREKPAESDGSSSDASRPDKRTPAPVPISTSVAAPCARPEPQARADGDSDPDDPFSAFGR